VKFKSYNNEVQNIEKDFEISELGAFATPGLHLAHVPLALIAESGFNVSPLARFKVSRSRFKLGDVGTLNVEV
jgi:hypothetical protein